MSKWQPIETAPKDGTVILVFNGTEGHKDNYYTSPGQIGTAIWGKQAFPRGSEGWCACDCCDGVTVYGGATHWMPLPEPPTEEQ